MKVAGNATLNVAKAQLLTETFQFALMGLTEREVVRDGPKADLTLFDPPTVDTPPTFADPAQFPVGIDYVPVDGTLVIDNEEHTEAGTAEPVGQRPR